MSIEKNIEAVYQRINGIIKAKNLKKEVTLVAVTKTATVEQIQQAIAAGIRDIGESRIQHAQEKFRVINQNGIKKHLIGHLQSNKAKKAVELFDLIQSVDSLALASEINKRAKELNIINA